MLHAGVFDDGRPLDQNIKSTWSKTSGQGNVSFSDIHNINASVSFTDTGTYVLRLTASDGELASYDEVKMEVPFVIAKQPINVKTCENTDARFSITVKSRNIVSYKWYKGGTPLNDVGKISGTSTPDLIIHNVSDHDAGQYWCHVYDLKDFDSDKAALVISQQAIPVIILHDGIMQSDYSSGNQWYFDNQPVLNAFNSTFTPEAEGDYYVIVTVDNCLVKSNVIKYIITKIDDQLDGNDINIFPNPATDMARVSINHNFISDFTVDVYNATGILIISLKKDKVENIFDLDMKNFPKGLYIIRLHNPEINYQLKIVKN
jgi:hypothetical protein